MVQAETGSQVAGAQAGPGRVREIRQGRSGRCEQVALQRRQRRQRVRRRDRLSRHHLWEGRLRRRSRLGQRRRRRRKRFGRMPGSVAADRHERNGTALRLLRFGPQLELHRQDQTVGDAHSAGGPLCGSAAEDAGGAAVAVGAEGDRETGTRAAAVVEENPLRAADGADGEGGSGALVARAGPAIRSRRRVQGELVEGTRAARNHAGGVRGHRAASACPPLPTRPMPIRSSTSLRRTPGRD